MAKRMKGFSNPCREWADIVWDRCVAIDSIISTWRMHSYEMSRHDSLIKSDLFPASPSNLRRDMAYLNKVVGQLISNATAWAEVWQKEQFASKEEDGTDEEANEYEEGGE